jgi:tetratricopeptide (TPR) repeat protein
METDKPQTASIRANKLKIAFSAMGIACLVIVLHGYLILKVFSPLQLSKYPRASEMYLKHELPAERLLDFSPLYLYLHVVSRELLAKPGPFIQWMHIFLTAVSASILFLLLHRFFHYATALVGGLAFVLDRSVIVYDQTFEPEPLVIFFLLGFLFYITKTRVRDHAVAGIFFALGILTRPNFLLVALLVPVYFYFQKVNREWLKSSFCFGVIVFTALTALWIRNANIIGYFSPFVMNPGTAIFEGNNPNSWGLSSVYPPVMKDLWKDHSDQPDYQHELYRRLARTITGSDLSVPQVNQYWTSKVVNYLVDHPIHALKLLRMKISNFFHQYQWHDLGNPFWNERKLISKRVPTIPFALVSSMALIGMILLGPKWKQFLLFYAVFFSQFIFMMVVYVSARQRVSIVSIFIFFFCACLQFVMEKRKHMLLILIILPLVFVLHGRTDFMEEEDHLWSGIEESNRFYKDAYQSRNEGQLQEAVTLTLRSIAAAPWFYDSRRLSNLSYGAEGPAANSLRFMSPRDFSTQFDSATLSINADRIGDAERTLNKLASNGYHFKRDQYEPSEPYYYLGRSAEKRKDKTSAVALFETALRRAPGNPATLAHLAVLTGYPEYRDKLFRYFDDVDAQFFLGKAYLEIGNGNEAAKCFSYVIQILPEYRSALIYLAASLGKAGKYEEGVARYRQAIKMKSDPLLLEEEILFLFRKRSEQSPDNSFTQYSYGVVLRQFGHFAEALEIQNKALLVDQRNQIIQDEIRSLEKLRISDPRS